MSFARVSTVAGGLTDSRTLLALGAIVQIVLNSTKQNYEFTWKIDAFWLDNRKFVETNRSKINIISNQLKYVC